MEDLPKMTVKVETVLLCTEMYQVFNKYLLVT